MNGQLVATNDARQKNEWIDGVTFAAQTGGSCSDGEMAEYHVAREAARVARPLGLECR